MKARLALITLMVATLTNLPLPIRGQAKPRVPQYLSQFPTVERVKAEVKGSDPIDTLARQQEAFYLLREMILALAGQRFDNDQMTGAEDELGSKYFDALQWYQYRERAPAPQDQPRWTKLLEFYAKDPGFLDELLKQFFTPEFRAGYYRTTKKQPPVSSQNAKANPPSGGAGAADAELGFPTEPTAVLSVTHGFKDQAPKPIAGMPVWLLNDSFGSLLRRTGLLDGPPGAKTKVTPLRVWATSCLTASPICGGMLSEVQGHIVGTSKMDATGRATFPAVPPGSYYVLTLSVLNQEALIWDLRVDLKSGANTVAIDPHNITPIDAVQTQA